MPMGRVDKAGCTVSGLAHAAGSLSVWSPVLFSSADQPSDYQGIIITSKHASRYLVEQANASSELRSLPVWCVGSGSANILRQAGFQSLMRARAMRLTSRSGLPAGAAGPFLWLSGRDVHLDMTACLKAQGITVKRQLSIMQMGAHPLSGGPGSFAI